MGGHSGLVLTGEWMECVPSDTTFPKSPSRAVVCHLVIRLDLPSSLRCVHGRALGEQPLTSGDLKEKTNLVQAIPVTVADVFMI
jgi:hypothetical protein